MTNKIGIMMVGKDEEVTAAIALKAGLKYLDYAIYVDTGSTDRTIEIIEHICSEELSQGRLSIKHVDIGEDLKMYEARAEALEILRQRDCKYFLKLDADEICYDDSLITVFNMAQDMDPNVTSVWFSAPELYQYKAATSKEWCQNIITNQGFYAMTNKRYGKDWLLRTDGCYATGNWTDETRGKLPEGCYFTKSKTMQADMNLLVHYGWARPMNSQIEKAKIRYGYLDTDWSFRVRDAHKEPWASKYQLKPFTGHPKALQRIAPIVLDLLHD